MFQRGLLHHPIPEIVDNRLGCELQSYKGGLAACACVFSSPLDTFPGV